MYIYPDYFIISIYFKLFLFYTTFNVHVFFDITSYLCCCAILNLYPGKK